MPVSMIASQVPAHGADWALRFWPRSNPQAGRLATDPYARLGESLRAYTAGPGAARWRITRAHEQDLRTMLLDGHVDAAVLWLPWQHPSLLMAAVTHVDYFAVLPPSLAAAHPDGGPASVFFGRPFAIWDRSEAALEHDYWVGLMERVAGGPSTS